MTKEKFKKITISLSDEEFLFVAKEAHKKDITWNQMANLIVLKGLKKMEAAYAKLQGSSKQNRVLVKNNRRRSPR